MDSHSTALVFVSCLPSYCTQAPIGNVPLSQSPAHRSSASSSVKWSVMTGEWQVGMNGGWVPDFISYSITGSIPFHDPISCDLVVQNYNPDAWVKRDGRDCGSPFPAWETANTLWHNSGGQGHSASRVLLSETLKQLQGSFKFIKSY